MEKNGKEPVHFVFSSLFRHLLKLLILFISWSSYFGGYAEFAVCFGLKMPL